MIWLHNISSWHETWAIKLKLAVQPTIQSIPAWVRDVPFAPPVWFVQVWWEQYFERRSPSCWGWSWCWREVCGLAYPQPRERLAVVAGRSDCHYCCLWLVLGFVQSWQWYGKHRRGKWSEKSFFRCYQRESEWGNTHLKKDLSPPVPLNEVAVCNKYTVHL